MIFSGAGFAKCPGIIVKNSAEQIFLILVFPFNKNYFMRYLLLLASVAFLFSCNDQKVSADAIAVKPPVAKKIPKEFHEHGNTRTDDYFWMNDPKDSNVINHLKDENAYTAAYMKHTEGLQKK